MIQWITAHWVEIGAAVALIFGAARAIVKLTPTPADDSVLEKIMGFLKHIGLHIDDKKE